MKKFVIVLLFLGIAFPAFALEYKAETPQAVNQILQQFYQEERGNRLSSFAIKSLATEINTIFMKNVVIEDVNATGKAPKSDG